MTVVKPALDRVEELAALDAPAGRVQHWLHRLLPHRRELLDPLTGSWLGHPLHPVLVLAPIGAWLSAGVLDMLPGQQPAARRLVATGMLAVVPAVVTGAADYHNLEGRQRRVGLVHLLANVTATVCYTGSYLSRRRGRAVGGKLLGALGFMAVVAGGTLGGHLTYAQGVGVYRWQPHQSDQRATEPRSAAVGVG